MLRLVPLLVWYKCSLDTHWTPLKLYSKMARGIKNSDLNSYTAVGLTPAVASVVYNATAFPIYRACLEEYNPYQAGFIAGVAVSPVDYGFSVGKIRRQCVRPQPIHFKGLTACSLRTIICISLLFRNI